MPTGSQLVLRNDIRRNVANPTIVNPSSRLGEGSAPWAYLKTPTSDNSNRSQYSWEGIQRELYYGGRSRMDHWLNFFLSDCKNNQKFEEGVGGFLPDRTPDFRYLDPENKKYTKKTLDDFFKLAFQHLKLLTPEALINLMLISIAKGKMYVLTTVYSPSLSYGYNCPLEFSYHYGLTKENWVWLLKKPPVISILLGWCAQGHDSLLAFILGHRTFSIDQLNELIDATRCEILRTEKNKGISLRTYIEFLNYLSVENRQAFLESKHPYGLDVWCVIPKLEKFTVADAKKQITKLLKRREIKSNERLRNLIMDIPPATAALPLNAFLEANELPFTLQSFVDMRGDLLSVNDFVRVNCDEFTIDFFIAQVRRILSFYSETGLKNPEAMIKIDGLLACFFNFLMLHAEDFLRTESSDYYKILYVHSEVFVSVVEQAKVAAEVARMKSRQTEKIIRAENPTITDRFGTYRGTVVNTEFVIVPGLDHVVALQSDYQSLIEAAEKFSQAGEREMALRNYSLALSKRIEVDVLKNAISLADPARGPVPEKIDKKFFDAALEYLDEQYAQLRQTDDEVAIEKKLSICRSILDFIWFLEPFHRHDILSLVQKFLDFVGRFEVSAQSHTQQKIELYVQLAQDILMLCCSNKENVSELVNKTNVETLVFMFINGFKTDLLIASSQAQYVQSIATVFSTLLSCVHFCIKDAAGERVAATWPIIHAWLNKLRDYLITMKTVESDVLVQEHVLTECFNDSLTLLIQQEYFISNLPETDCCNHLVWFTEYARDFMCRLRAANAQQSAKKNDEDVSEEIASAVFQPWRSFEHETTWIATIIRIFYLGVFSADSKKYCRRIETFSFDLTEAEIRNLPLELQLKILIALTCLHTKTKLANDIVNGKYFLFDHSKKLHALLLRFPITLQNVNSYFSGYIKLYGQYFSFLRKNLSDTFEAHAKLLFAAIAIKNLPVDGEDKIRECAHLYWGNTSHGGLERVVYDAWIKLLKEREFNRSDLQEFIATGGEWELLQRLSHPDMTQHDQTENFVSGDPKKYDWLLKTFAQNGNVAAVRELIKQGANPECAMFNGDSLLIVLMDQCLKIDVSRHDNHKTIRVAALLKTFYLVLQKVSVESRQYIFNKVLKRIVEWRRAPLLHAEKHLICLLLLKFESPDSKRTLFNAFLFESLRAGDFLLAQTLANERKDLVDCFRLIEYLTTSLLIDHNNNEISGQDCTSVVLKILGNMTSEIILGAVIDAPDLKTVPENEDGKECSWKREATDSLEKSVAKINELKTKLGSDKNEEDNIYMGVPVEHWSIEFSREEKIKLGELIIVLLCSYQSNRFIHLIPPLWQNVRCNAGVLPQFPHMDKVITFISDKMQSELGVFTPVSSPEFKAKLAEYRLAA